MGKADILHGNNLELLRNIPDNSVDAIVTDPPYGLKFMGKKWDYEVPTVAQWKECLRVLKPGGYLLSFAGTRTQHRMACNIEDAGFEIRDMIAWVYGCLSEDTEIFTNEGWVAYDRLNKENAEIIVYDTKTDTYKWEKPKRWNEYNVHKDTAFRIQSDYTDQIVSRGHRCLVEREGKLVFVPADELSNMEYMPSLPNDFHFLQEATSEVLQSGVQRILQGSGVEEMGSDWCGKSQAKYKTKGTKGRNEPCMERGLNLLQEKGEVCRSADQVCEVSDCIYSDGEERRLCNGTSFNCSNGDRQTTNKGGVCSSYQSQCDRQQIRESNAIQNQCRPQEVRTQPTYSTSLATITPIEYTGVIFCPTVSTGAFIARRSGKIFITGNSGFPKSLNIGKAIDALQGNEREDVGEIMGATKNTDLYNLGIGDKKYIKNTKGNSEWEGWGTSLKPSLEPITVARKPLSEKTVAENCLKWGTGGINIDECRVECEGGSPSQDRRKYKTPTGDYNGWDCTSRNGYNDEHSGEGIGRFPANLIHDGSDEVLECFPQSKGQCGDLLNHDKKTQSPNGIYGTFPPRNDTIKRGDEGSAARFFYCAKASRSERNIGCEDLEDSHFQMRPFADEGCDQSVLKNRMNSKIGKNNHPTVKPIKLMEYLIKLVSKEGAVILDPWAGSGTTGIACVKLNRQFILMEQDEHSYDIMKARVSYFTPEVNITIPQKKEIKIGEQMELF